MGNIFFIPYFVYWTLFVCWQIIFSKDYTNEQFASLRLRKHLFFYIFRYIYSQNSVKNHQFLVLDKNYLSDLFNVLIKPTGTSASLIKQESTKTTRFLTLFPKVFRKKSAERNQTLSAKYEENQFWLVYQPDGISRRPRQYEHSRSSRGPRAF